MLFGPEEGGKTSICSQGFQALKTHRNRRGDRFATTVDPSMSWTDDRSANNGHSPKGSQLRVALLRHNFDKSKTVSPKYIRRKSLERGVKIPKPSGAGFPTYTIMKSNVEVGVSNRLFPRRERAIMLVGCSSSFDLACLPRSLVGGEPDNDPLFTTCPLSPRSLPSLTP